MFFWKRHKIKNEVVKLVKPLIGAVQSTSGLPRWFWSDAYNLGFIITLSAHIMRAASNGKLNENDISIIIDDVINECSVLNSNQILKKAGLLARERNNEFLEGAGLASVVYITSIQNLRSSVDINDAKITFKEAGLAWSDSAESKYLDLLKTSDDPAADLLLKFWYERFWEERYGE